MNLRHVDLAGGSVYQDARDVDTKSSKSFTTFFFPVGDEISQIVVAWVTYLRQDKLWSNSDSLFTATHVCRSDDHRLVASGLKREHWRTAGPIRQVFREAFTVSGLRYFRRHSARNTLAQLRSTFRYTAIRHPRATLASARYLSQPRRPSPKRAQPKARADQASASARPAERVWGGRWRATEEKALSNRGAFQVWVVEDLRGEVPELCALKVIREGRSLTEGATKRFRREIEVMRKLAAEGVSVVPVLDFHLRETAAGHASFYVMRRYSSTLERECRARAGDARFALDQVRALALVLRRVHTTTIHRDIKPANVFLDGEDLRPLLADFGICFVLDADRLTHEENQTLGTEQFVAPELYGDGPHENVTAAADIYSLGKSLYAIAAGGEVFRREFCDDPRWDLTKRFSGDFALAHVAGVVRRMVRFKPVDRPSLDEVVSLLDRATTNVKQGVRYADGMYDGDSPPPEERAERLRRRLKAVAEIDRAAVVLSESESSSLRIDALLNERGAEVSLLRDVHAEALTRLLPAAAEVAEEILAPSIAALDVGLPEKAVEFISRLANEARRTKRYEYDPWRVIHEAAEVAAYVTLGAVAWRRRSPLVLAHVVQTYANRDGDFTHLTALGRGSAVTAPWIERVAHASRVVAASSVPVSRDAMSRALAAVHGLATLRWCLTRVTAERLVDLGRTGQGAPPLEVPWLPGFHLSEQEASWPREISRAFLDDRHWEESASQAVLAMSAVGARDRARAATPLIVRAAAKIAYEMPPGRRDFYWPGHVGAEEWKQWTELAEP